MRPDQGNPLDLNNLPDDSSRDHGKQHALDDASTGYRKKKNGAKEECGKVYECRFCSLKFCKSQALGGHMNRHRQERETETLNRARQLVFTNDNLAPQPHLSCCHPMTQPPPGYHHGPPPGGMGSDPTMPLRFPTRMFSGSSSSSFVPAPMQPPVQPSQNSFLYPSPTRPLSYSPQYPPHHQHGAGDHYYVGHVLGGGNSSSPPSVQYSFPNLNYAAGAGESGFTCISAPVGHGFGRGSGSELADSGRSPGIRGDGSLR